MKYRPEFPKRFENIQDARAFCVSFFNWYNYEHHHTGIGLYTPASVHDGTWQELRAKRQQTLFGAYNAHPERFVNGTPIASQIPEYVWINEPKEVKTN